MTEIPLIARVGLQSLVLRDPALATIEADAGQLPWRTRPGGFTGLLQAIVAQQISNAAASAIWRRMVADEAPLDPHRLLAMAPEALQGLGLSRPKVSHARSLAQAFVEGSLSQAGIAALDDEAAIAAITRVRGLGRWTAEVYLLFAEQRMDVFPANDVALAGAAMALHALETRPSERALRLLAERWRPHRALAARLLWHHWRHLTGRPAMDDLPPA